jgi:hypothetical protein
MLEPEQPPGVPDDNDQSGPSQDEDIPLQVWLFGIPLLIIFVCVVYRLIGDLR